MTQLDSTSLLEEICAIWQVKPADTQPIESGFHWWPGHHRVTVRCARKQMPGDEAVWRLTVGTDYLLRVDLEDVASIINLLGLGAYAPTYAWVFTPADIARQYKIPLTGAVTLHSATYVRAATAEWMPRLFAQMSIMQAIDAQRSADSFGAMLKGRADKSGERLAAGPESFDDILNVASVVLAPAGQEPSRWRDSPEFAAAVQRLNGTDACAGQLHRGGAAFEIPFGANAALITLRHDIAHPALGQGLLGTIRLPVLQSQADTAQVCAWLNHLGATSWTEVPVHGTWHPQELGDGRFCPAYGAFIPNALHAEGLATNLAVWNIALARWARRTGWVNLEDKTMPEILAARHQAKVASGEVLW